MKLIRIKKKRTYDGNYASEKENTYDTSNNA